LDRLSPSDTFKLVSSGCPLFERNLAFAWSAVSGAGVGHAMPGNNVTSECLQQRIRERQLLTRSKLRWRRFNVRFGANLSCAPSGRFWPNWVCHSTGCSRPIPAAAPYEKRTLDEMHQR